MKKIKSYILSLMLITSILATSVNMEVEASTNDNEIIIPASFKDGEYTYTDKINETDESNHLLRATSIKTGEAGVIITKVSNGLKIAEIKVEADFSYDGKYVWATYGVPVCSYMRSGYSRTITKNTYSSTKVTSKSIYYTTSKIYYGSTLFDTATVNLSCTPYGQLGVTY